MSGTWWKQLGIWEHKIWLKTLRKKTNNRYRLIGNPNNQVIRDELWNTMINMFKELKDKTEDFGREVEL